MSHFEIHRRRQSAAALLRSVRFAAVLLVAAGAAFAQERGSAMKEGPAGHLSPRSTLRDLLHHPAFAGFGPLLLPWDGRAYDEALPFSKIGSLLPYHTEVHPETVTHALNRMVDDVNGGKPVFYRFYDATERQEQPDKNHTGLFYFRGKPGAPFAIISPGGGFSYVGSVHEGFPYAAELSRRGYNAFVLRYRAGQGAAVATQDLAAAVTYIFRNAQTLGVSTSGYSLWGSSAGARMAASIGSHGAAAFGGAQLPKPTVVVMAYTGHSDHSSDEPATFVVVGERDGIAPPAAMERRVAELRKVGSVVEFRRYPKLGHGFGVGTGTSAEGWIAEGTRFWERILRERD